DAAQLAGAEPDGEGLPLAHKHLMPAFYLNELVINLTTRHDPQPQLFDDYARALRRLCVEVQPEPALRVFEKRLLECIGYGLELDVVAENHYQFGASQGLYEVREDAPGAYAGRTLLALREESLDDPQTLDVARRVLRQALDHCLEGREIRTRNVARS